MNRKNVFMQSSFAALFVLALIGVAASRSKPDAKVSRPMEYRGYTFPEYKSFIKKSVYVPMKDGVKLAVDIYLPADGPSRKSFPTAFQYLPYSRAFIDLKNGPLHKIGRKMLLDNPSPILDQSRDKIVKSLLAYGYVFVIADMRGTGASYGWKADFMPQFSDDGAELVDWIASQPWSDGKVGMYGGSYLGYSQLAVAGKASDALKCIVPTVVPLDGYDGQVYPGGIYCNGFMSAYSKGLTKLNLNYYSVSVGKLIFGGDMDGFSLPTAPVVDEDGDGDIRDEIPLDLDGNGTFLNDYKFPDDPNDAPKYRDGKSRKHIYYLATKDHEKNIDYHSWAKFGTFLDGATPKGFDGYTAYDLGPNAYVPAIMKKKIAIYNLGGWFDTFVRGTTELYSTMKDTNVSKLAIAPMYHSGGGPFWKYLGEDPSDLEDKLSMELIRYYDHYLKGVDNGIDTEAPIMIYVMNGGGWRMENEWPLKREVPTKFYLSDKNSISETAGSGGADTYKADFTHDSRYGTTNGNRYMAAMGIAPDTLPIRTEKDKQCLTYNLSPMQKDVEVTGHPIVELWVSSTADYGDFYVYLEDVDEKGMAILVTEGTLRAEFAKLYDNNEMIYSGKYGIDVKPDLPWHGYEKDEYRDKPLANGAIIELVLDLRPTSWTFRKGHSIRVSIACADWPTFQLHPKLAPNNKPDDPANIVPTITVYRDAQHQSLVTLPIIPGKE